MVSHILWSYDIFSKTEQITENLNITISIPPKLLNTHSHVHDKFHSFYLDFNEQ